MKLLERRVVSRKTPGDGRLEITKVSAASIERRSQPLAVELDGAAIAAALTTMPCTCRGAEQPHVHYFLQSEAFRTLREAEAVNVQLDEARGRVVVSRAPDVTG